MTRAEDVARAASLGASYVGVIFAGGPRHQTLESAQHFLAGAARPVRRVAVIADQTPIEIAGLVRALRIDIVQIHADPTAQRVADIRQAIDVELWSVIRVAGESLPESFEELADVSDGIVLDAKAPDGRGGSGMSLPWRRLRDTLASRRLEMKIILAGGLKAENVAGAIVALEPDIVDVSSGVESAPGIKDHVRMRAFRDAVSGAGVKE